MQRRSIGKSPCSPSTPTSVLGWMLMRRTRPSLLPVHAMLALTAISASMLSGWPGNLKGEGEVKVR